MKHLTKQIGHQLRKRMKGGTWGFSVRQRRKVKPKPVDMRRLQSLKANGTSYNKQTIDTTHWKWARIQLKVRKRTPGWTQIVCRGQA